MKYVLVWVLVSWLVAASQKASAKPIRNGVEFTGSIAMRIALILTGVVSFLGGVYSAVTLRDFALLTISMMICVIALIAFPSRLRLTSEGIEQHTLWKKSRLVSWSDVTSLVGNSEFANAYIVSRDGSKIRHTPLHGDRGRFVEECSERSGLKPVLIEN